MRLAGRGAELADHLGLLARASRAGHGREAEQALGAADGLGGGAMPYASSLRRPSAVSQSLVQGGESTSSTLASWKPASTSARSTRPRITSVAGTTRIRGRDARHAAARPRAGSRNARCPGPRCSAPESQGPAPSRARCHASSARISRAVRTGSGQAWRGSQPSPARSRIRAMQGLHLREQIAEVLGVLAPLAVPGVRHVRRPLQRRGSSASHRCAHSSAACRSARRGATPGGRHRFIDLVRAQRTRSCSARSIERGLRALHGSLRCRHRAAPASPLL